MPLHAGCANFLLQQPLLPYMDTPHTHIHIYIFIWPVRSPSSSLLLFYLNTSSFRFVPWHLAAILCQFPVSVIRTGEPENGEWRNEELGNSAAEDSEPQMAR